MDLTRKVHELSDACSDMQQSGLIDGSEAQCRMFPIRTWLKLHQENLFVACGESGLSSLHLSRKRNTANLNHWTEEVLSTVADPTIFFKLLH